MDVIYFWRGLYLTFIRHGYYDIGVVTTSAKKNVTVMFLQVLLCEICDVTKKRDRDINGSSHFSHLKNQV